MPSREEILAVLRRYWGYDSFRPLQERVVTSLLSGRDTCVVMPTGGGKSLCYQLPAAMRPGKTVIVVSPLIALMHDQVMQLTQMGIAAGLLNSTLSSNEQVKVARLAAEGQYRLLYLSPERLARPDTIAWLKRVPVSLFAIDEAHCISEWGHEFRPDYRQLSSLREHFPDLAIAAFTASATRRVRHDIIDQLRLRDPHKYIASFHRANLRYVVKECRSETQSDLLVRALRSYAEGHAIVYAPTINQVGQTVSFLEAQGIPAVTYHGKMEAAERQRNQERWMSDEVPVLVGTLAFGLGINKACVRAVIHLALPKSLEQYYQEAGRAGRDGQPSDCVLLWQKRDVGLLAYFMDQIEDPEEKQRGWQRYREICGYAQSQVCRHRQICLHFGESPKWGSCGACDVCAATPDWLTPAGAVAERPAAESTLSPVARRRASPQAQRSAVSEGSNELREYLRMWRREAAKKQGIPAFTVMHDTSLDDLCRVMPESLAALRGVYGFGERKTERYGPEILAAIRHFRQGERASEASTKKLPAREETLKLVAEGKALDEVAKIRECQVGSVVALVASMVEGGEMVFRAEWVAVEKQAKIESVCAEHGMERLAPIKAALPAEITFDEIRLVVARLRHERMSQQSVAGR